LQAGSQAAEGRQGDRRQLPGLRRACSPARWRRGHCGIPRACSSLAHGATRGANLLTRETVDVVAGVENMYLTGLSIRLLALLIRQAVAIIDRGFTRYQQLASAPAAAAAEVAPATA
jgi:hypothetical protein